MKNQTLEQWLCKKLQGSKIISFWSRDKDDNDILITVRRAVDGRLEGHTRMHNMCDGMQAEGEFAPLGDLTGMSIPMGGNIVRS